MHLQGVPMAIISAWLGHAETAFTRPSRGICSSAIAADHR